MKRILPKLLGIPYQYFLLKSLLTTSLAVLLQLLFQNYLSILILRILRKQCIEKVNGDPDEIDISSDDSDLKDNDHIEAIKAYP